MYTFKSLKTSELGKLDIKKIIKLKDTFWEFGERIQYEWFIKNIKKMISIICFSKIKFL